MEDCAHALFRILRMYLSVKKCIPGMPNAVMMDDGIMLSPLGSLKKPGICSPGSQRYRLNSGAPDVCTQCQILQFRNDEAIRSPNN